jgi:protein-S-isoprenylcysteine O-methyltransferase Ste14
VSGVRDSANVLGSPPVVLFSSIAVGVLLHLLIPGEALPGFAAWVLGAPLVLAALALFALSAREFGRRGTPVRGTEPVTTVVTTGPYRLSRNPIYLAFVLLQLGIGVSLNSLWLHLTLLSFIAYLSIGVIAREEEYLERKFGDEYLRYKASVRRWI